MSCLLYVQLKDSKNFVIFKHKVYLKLVISSHPRVFVESSVIRVKGSHQSCVALKAISLVKAVNSDFPVYAVQIIRGQSGR